MRNLTLLMILVAALSGGCAGLRGLPATGEPWVKPGGPRPAGDSESLLMYFEYVRKLPAPELVKEHEMTRESYVKSHSDFNRVRYAMVLAVPGSAFNDEARALEEIDPLVKNADAPLHGVAYLLNLQIQDQRHDQSLQRKLDALKSLEKSLIERGR